MDTLESRVSACLPLAQALCLALRDRAAGLGFDGDALPPTDSADAHFRLERDPADGSDSLVGEWLDRHGHRVGMLLFHVGGTYFAEHDIARVHPADPTLFVEAVEAWGSDGRISADMRAMPMIGAAEASAE